MLIQLLERPWLAAAAWAALYISDYALTIACARLYRRQSVVVFEGSYEITPAFQADVDAVRSLSPRFMLALVGSTAYVWMMGVIVGTIDGMEDLYAVMIGAMLLLQLSIHLRHVRNWFLFRHGMASVRGRIEYGRSMILRASSVELLSFAVLYLVLSALTWSALLLGGAISCAVCALNHYGLALRHDKRVAAEV